MFNVFLVAAGGAAGATSRYLLTVVMGTRADGWPWPVFLINVAGSFLIGLLTGWLTTREADGEVWRLLLGTGFLGGFTTFSAYSADTLRMMERGETASAAGYALGSVLAGLLAVWLGVSIARRMVS